MFPRRKEQNWTLSERREYLLDIVLCRKIIEYTFQIDISRDVIFDEDVAFSKSINSHTNEYKDYEHEAPKVE